MNENGFESSRLDRLAQKSRFSKRSKELLDEKEGNSIRSKFQRDRDRIIFSKAFRRMVHKTQVYLSHEGNEHKRNRLTHTLEVVQIARIIASNLRMNESLVEAIAYGHDLGHAPFGHAGERQLNRFLRYLETLPDRICIKIGKLKNHVEDQCLEHIAQSKEDFRHNYQSVRCIAFLEKYHDDYSDAGLNLTENCLEGILKHTKLTPIIVDKDRKTEHDAFIFPGIRDGIFRSLHLDVPFSISIEGQIVRVADEIAQVTHDLSDALRIGSISFEALSSNKNVSEILKGDVMRWGDRHEGIAYSNDANAQFISVLLNYLIVKSIEMFRQNLRGIRVAGLDSNIILDRYLYDEKDVINDAAFVYLRDIKNEMILNNYSLNRMDSKGEYIIRKLFNAYLTNPRQLPDKVLDYFCCRKKSIAEKLGFNEIIKRLEKTRRTYQISAIFEDSELNEMNNLLFTHNADGKHFRMLSPKIFEKIIPYLIFDNDFMRGIVDYIASMTDLYAEEEFSSLYQSSY